MVYRQNSPGGLSEAHFFAAKAPKTAKHAIF